MQIIYYPTTLEDLYARGSRMESLAHFRPGDTGIREPVTLYANRQLAQTIAVSQALEHVEQESDAQDAQVTPAVIGVKSLSSNSTTTRSPINVLNFDEVWIANHGYNALVNDCDDSTLPSFEQVDLSEVLENLKPEFRRPYENYSIN